MTLRNILVHLDSGGLTAERLHFATNLAARHQARLVGVFAQLSAPYRVGIVSKWPSEEYQQASAASRAAFEAATAGLAAAEWMDLNRGGEHEILRLMTDLARHFDVTILGQQEAGPSRQVPADMCEEIILESGRPALVIPYAGQFHTIGHRPFVAWTDARSAARALNDAVPLMSADADALVVSVLREDDTRHPSLDMTITHLRCHGMSARAEGLILQDFGLMDLLLSRVADHSADMMVIGAFGGYGLPLLNRGSGTRFLLRHMTVPVLFSH